MWHVTNNPSMSSKVESVISCDILRKDILLGNIAILTCYSSTNHIRDSKTEK